GWATVGKASTSRMRQASARFMKHLPTRSWIVVVGARGKTSCPAAGRAADQGVAPWRAGPRAAVEADCPPRGGAPARAAGNNRWPPETELRPRRLLAAGAPQVAGWAAAGLAFWTPPPGRRRPARGAGQVRGNG